MNITVIQPRVSYFVGGSEKVALKHMEVLFKKGHHQITLYTVKPVDGKYSPFYIHFRENFPNIITLELEIPSNYKYIYDELPETTQSRWDREAILFSNIVHPALLGSESDVVMYYYIVDSVFRALDIPSIVYLGGHPEGEIEIYNAFLSFCDATVSNSKNVKRMWEDKLKKNNVPLNYIVNKGAEIPLKVSNPFKSEGPHIVFAGRLIKGKGVDVLIESFAKLNTSFPDAKLWVLGNGLEKQSYVERVQNLGLAETILFPGTVENVFDYFKYATLCVFPSTRMEGLMTTVIEAMSVGACVITTKNIGNEELIEDQRTGILVEANNVHALHDTLVTLLQNQSLREKLGREAQMHVAEHHTWERIGTQLENILQEVVAFSK